MQYTALEQPRPDHFPHYFSRTQRRYAAIVSEDDHTVRTWAAYIQTPIFIEMNQSAQRQYTCEQVQRAASHVHICRRRASPAKWQAAGSHATAVRRVATAAAG
jgi:hypothetical protein